MPTARISVAHMLDVGPLGSLAAPVALEQETVAPPPPGETTVAVMAAAKRVSATDRFNPVLAKAILAAKNPAQLAAASIKARHAALGGTAGFLGANTTPVTACPDGIGFYQHFKAGSIYWSPHTGAHEVHGAIRQKWSAMGWERSFLGYPATCETVGRDHAEEGRFNRFQHGAIYWHPSTGAHEVHGAILARYRALGAEASVLGYPTTDETGTPDRVGRFNHFQAGSIYWTPATGAHEVHGLIRHFWAQNGWERNPRLGYPISDELTPHRGVGHTRPPSLRKPLVALPLDVIRVPEEQPSPTLPLIVATQPALLARTNTSATALAGATRPAATSTRPELAGAILDRESLVSVVELHPSLLNPTASRTGQSQDRYGDFENGVVFWKRGAPSAHILQPRAQAPNGARMAWTGAEVAALAGVPIRAALQGMAGAAVVATTYVGTTGYSWDGAGVRNRNHRIHVRLQGMRMAGATPVTAVATLEVRVEIGLDPVDREVVGYLTRWSLVASQGDFIGGGSLVRTLHQRLDPALSRQFLVTKIPATAQDQIAVLSVKTEADGDVVTYFEP
jgi:hypothetical protein